MKPDIKFEIGDKVWIFNCEFIYEAVVVGELAFGYKCKLNNGNFISTIDNYMYLNPDDIDYLKYDVETHAYYLLDKIKQIVNSVE